MRSSADHYLMTMAMAMAARYGQPGVEKQFTITVKILHSDWCCHSSGDRSWRLWPLLLPGPISPSTKWKSEWRIGTGYEARDHLGCHRCSMKNKGESMQSFTGLSLNFLTWWAWVRWWRLVAVEKEYGKHVTIHTAKSLCGKCNGHTHHLDLVYHQNLLRKQKQNVTVQFWLSWSLEGCSTCCGQSYLVNLVSLVTPQMCIWRRDMERIYVYTEMVDECS